MQIQEEKERKERIEREREVNLKDNISRIKYKIVILSGKGGVGKSTVAVNLAYGLGLRGKKVGILDIDIHGPSLAKMLGIEGKVMQIAVGRKRPAPIKVVENIYALTIASMLKNPDQPIIWRGPLKMHAIKQFLSDIEWPPLDYLIIDCPPGTGDEPLSIIQLLKKVDGAIIVSTPQDVAFLDARKTINFAKALDTPILGIIENMSGFKCPYCGKDIDLFKKGGAKKAAIDLKVDILGEIPIDTNIVNTSDNGRPFIYDFNKLPAAKSMEKIVDKVLEKFPNK
ncbi:MAG: ATP-binding protein [Candidatus Cloacimonadota bacterium]|nr:MAG: ATP-binding protein [Candidatus Cloacimonadota bacterium]